MPQPRKTLGDIHSDICLQLMRLMETQSKATLARWAIGYARKQYLPICREACPELETVVNDCMACAQQGKPAAQYKDRMRTAAALARASQGPAAQAAARAVAVACAVMQPPPPMRLDSCFTEPRLRLTHGRGWTKARKNTMSWPRKNCVGHMIHCVPVPLKTRKIRPESAGTAERIWAEKKR